MRRAGALSLLAIAALGSAWFVPACLADLPPPDPAGDASANACAPIPSLSGCEPVIDKDGEGCRPLDPSASTCLAEHDCGCACPAGATVDCAQVTAHPEVDDAAGCIAVKAGGVGSWLSTKTDCILCRRELCAEVCDGVGVLLGSSGRAENEAVPATMVVNVDEADLPPAGRFGVFLKVRGAGTLDFRVTIGTGDGLQHSFALPDPPDPGGHPFEALVLWDDLRSPTGPSPIEWSSEKPLKGSIKIEMGPTLQSPMIVEVDCVVPFVVPAP